jgi:hypothetical protein
MLAAERVAVGRSLWLATAPPAAYPSLEGDRRTEVAVVGDSVVAYALGSRAAG